MLEPGTTKQNSERIKILVFFLEKVEADVGKCYKERWGLLILQLEVRVELILFVDVVRDIYLITSYLEFHGFL